MTSHVYVEDKSMVKIFVKVFEISKMFWGYLIRINKISGGGWGGGCHNTTRPEDNKQDNSDLRKWQLGLSRNLFPKAQNSPRTLYVKK